MPYFDTVIPLSMSNHSGSGRYVRQLIRTWFQFRRWEAQLILHPTISRSLAADWIVKAIRSPIKVGWDGNQDNYSSTLNQIPGLRYTDTATWYSQLIPYPSNMMELEANARFNSAICDRQIAPQLPELSTVIPPVPGPKLIDGSYVVISPCASAIGKNWPLESFAAIGHSLPTSFAIVLCGSPADRPLCDRLKTLISTPSRTLVNLAGQTSLPQLCEVIRNATLIISNDSAMPHVASAFQVPSVVILGGGHFGRFLPYSLGPATIGAYAPKAIYTKMPCFNCNWECIYPGQTPWPCIQAIHIEMVIDAVSAAINSQQ